MSSWKLSIGTAGAIGIRKLKTDALPTTAYIMLGEKCTRNCAFCAQAHTSTAAAKFLSRVAWQDTSEDVSIEHLVKAYKLGKIKRACLQVVNRPDSLETVKTAVQDLVAAGLPVVVSGYITSVKEAKGLFDLGVDRIGLAMDVATPDLFAEIKGGSWQKRWELLCSCAVAFPGKMTTHLIVGLGETEAEMWNIIKECYARDITVGLFAFTPLPGTAMADRPQPKIGSYRRLQIAFGLLKRAFSPDVVVCSGGEIVSFKVKNIGEVLADGDAFRTSGCHQCNRPFYNERPGQILYNYPRALSPEELRQAFVESEVVTW
ncbi:MAG: radical SAM protein [Acidaminococcaceae bacterium]|nr:radical SAM protein [Acidaminococcaceae bacterium]MDD4721283.1 radical SAM protein [Acidaminococcaceae bacterium]